MEAKTSTWIGGAVVVGLLMGLGGWALAISPALSTASDTRAEALDVTARNEMLASKLVTLKQQFEHLEEFKAEVLAIEAQIPATAQLDEFLRQVAAHAEATGTFVVDIAAATPTPVLLSPATSTGSTESTDQPTEAAGDESSDGETSGDAEAEVPAPVSDAPVAIDGFVAVPVDITLLGDVYNVTRMLAALQADNQRLFLVTTFTGKGTGEKEAGEGRPATTKGQLELTVSGYLYVLKDPAAVVAEPEPAKPLPSGDGAGSPLTGA